jgi:hypothetical protein
MQGRGNFLSMGTPKAFAASALVYAALGVLGRLVPTVWQLVTEEAFPRLWHAQTLWEGALVFGLCGVACWANPSGSGSRFHPRGRTLAVFWILHLALPIQCLGLPHPKAFLLTLAAGFMVFSAVVTAAVAAFSQKSLFQEPAEAPGPEAAETAN